MDLEYSLRSPEDARIVLTPWDWVWTNCFRHISAMPGLSRAIGLIPCVELFAAPRDGICWWRAWCSVKSSSRLLLGDTSACLEVCVLLVVPLSSHSDRDVAV